MDQNELEQHDLTAAEQEDASQDVEIREAGSDAPVTDDQPVQAQEAGEDPPEPAALSEDEVSAILEESKLDEKSKDLLRHFTYQTRDDLDARIGDLTDLFAGAGKPFALGEDAVLAETVPPLLSAQELEKRAQERTIKIIEGVAPSLAHNLI